MAASSLSWRWPPILGVPRLRAVRPGPASTASSPRICLHRVRHPRTPVLYVTGPPHARRASSKLDSICKDRFHISSQSPVPRLGLDLIVLGNTVKPIEQVTSGLEVLVERNEKGVLSRDPGHVRVLGGSLPGGCVTGLVSNLSDHEHLSLLVADRAERSRRKAVLSRGSCPSFWGGGVPGENVLWCTPEGR